MYIYALLFLAFIVQEPVTSGAMLLEAYQLHCNVWIIHILFLVATCIDIFFGYYIGSHVQRQFGDSKIIQYAKKKSEVLSVYAGQYGQKMMLVVFGQMIFPVSAFVTPWLKISLWDSFVYLFIGELILWYGALWLLVLGIKISVVDPQMALYVIVGITLVVTIGMRYYRTKASQ